MKAIHKLNISLALIILVLLLLNLQTEDSGYLPLTSIATDSVFSISLTNPQGTLNFFKTDKSWSLTKAPEKTVNQENIVKLLGIIRTHSYRQFENTDNNRKSFALDNPKYKIILNDVSILFGSNEPTQQLRYILINNRIHLINDLYLQYLLADEDFFTHLEQ